MVIKEWHNYVLRSNESIREEIKFKKCYMVVANRWSCNNRSGVMSLSNTGMIRAYDIDNGWFGDGKEYPIISKQIRNIISCYVTDNNEYGRLYFAFPSFVFKLEFESDANEIKSKIMNMYSI